ncbi:MAG: type II toxin-antitoxin system VapC family toxin [Hahellaceae bacterium]|nr:type II toxin-antitoxin system VapC family toxin [Hahellaceae bacterium]
MIGLDTNIIIRYITQDEEKQALKATQVIESQLSAKAPGFITLITLVEITWVLESCYEQSQQNILNVLHGLLTTKQLVVEKADAAYLALKRCLSSPKADFSDALIAVLSEQAGCTRVLTFDKQARQVGMELL